MHTNVFHRYTSLEEIGSSDFSMVYKAQDTLINRTVALKVLPKKVLSGAYVKSKVLTEASLLSKLDHPNIGIVYDVGETTYGQMYLVMRYYKGETLQERLLRGPVEVKESLEFALQIASGLQAAHQQGIIHHDLKPSNILLTHNGGVKILDFGLARFLKDQGTSDQRHYSGTPAYIAPEQITDHVVTEKSDIWAYGVVLYEMLTSYNPFQSHNINSVLYKIVNNNPHPASQRNPNLPDGFDELLSKLLNKNPSLRPDAIREVKKYLQDLSDSISTPKSDQKRQLKHTISLIPIHVFPVNSELQNLSDRITRSFIENIESLKQTEIVDSAHIKTQNGNSPSIRRGSSTVDSKFLLDGILNQFDGKHALNLRITEGETPESVWQKRYEFKASEETKIIPFILKDLSNTLQNEDISVEYTHSPGVENGDTKITALYKTGMMHFWKAHYDTRSYQDLLEAKRIFKRGIQQEPSFAPFHAFLAGATFAYEYFYSKSYTRTLIKHCIDLCRTSLELDPKFAESYSMMAIYFFLLRDYPAMKECIKTALEINPCSKTALNLSGWCHCLSGEVSVGLRQIKKAFFYDSLGVESFHYLIKAYYFSGQINKAIELAQTGLTLLENKWIFNLDLSYLYLIRGDYEEAFALYEEYSGENEDGFHGYAYARMGNTDSANQLAQKFIENNNLYDAALTLTGLGKTKRALKLLLELLQAYRENLNPINAEHREDFGTVHADPRFDPIRSEPGYQELRERMGLPSKHFQNEQSTPFKFDTNSEYSQQSEGDRIH